MLFWRKFEDKLAAVYIQQKVRGFLHLYNGQEAVLAGALHVMDTTKDRMITAYRNHVMPIGMGVDPKKVMAELYGKNTGTSNGLGGSMHIFSRNTDFMVGMVLWWTDSSWSVEISITYVMLSHYALWVTEQLDKALFTKH